MTRQLFAMLIGAGIAVGAPVGVGAVPARRSTSSCIVHAPEASNRSGLNIDVIVRVMQAESGGDARAVSAKGAIGCMQIMPPTWADLTARYGLGSDSFDARMNMVGGALYLAELTRAFGPTGAYAAYNTGPARYIRYVANAAPLPAETVAYVARLRGDRRGGLSAPVPVRWQAASLFLARLDATGAESQASASAPDVERRGWDDDPEARMLVSRAKTLAVLFPLSRNETLTQPQ